MFESCLRNYSSLSWLLFLLDYDSMNCADVMPEDRLHLGKTQINLVFRSICTIFAPRNNKNDENMGYSNHDKMEWTLIFAAEFGRRFGLTLKQAFNYLSRFGGIKFVDEHYDYCHTQSFQSMVSDMAEYCHRKGGALV